MKLRVDEGGELVLSDVFNGIGIETDQGMFGIAQRDSGIEVMLDGKSVWLSTDAMAECVDSAPEETRRHQSLKSWQEMVHANAVEKGWWPGDRNFGELCMLMVTELAESFEEWREGKPLMYWKRKHPETEKVEVVAHDMEAEPDELIARGFKFEGIAVEMADAVIRILDWAGREGVDLGAIMELKHRYNETRKHRHGGKRA